MSGKRKKNKPVRFTDGVPPNEQQRKAKGELTDVCAGKGQNLYQIGDNWFRRGELYDASQQIAALKTVLGPEEYDRRKVRKFTEDGGGVDQVENFVGKNEDEDEEDSEEDEDSEEEDSEEEDSDNEKEEDAAGGDNADEEKKQPGGKGKKRKSPPARKKQAKKDKFLPPPALSQ
jgi:cobalamin biosynthesis protein CobT